MDEMRPASTTIAGACRYGEMGDLVRALTAWRQTWMRAGSW